ncbi:MAG: hypothetical protein HPY69_13235 [Armatimonadetes bacterium]|nr:hypothetical protein [Armatimonadota bacterium]
MPSSAQPQPVTDLTITSPRPLQVIQRRTRAAGEVLVSGRAAVLCDRIEAQVTGRSLSGDICPTWEPVPLFPATGVFQGLLLVPAGGWYDVEVRAVQGGETVAAATVSQVGVGEVFVTAGQSNSTNAGQFPIQQHSGMVSSFSGRHWQIADDPQPGCHDESTGGSPWPAMGDALYAAYEVPIGIAATGHGATSVNQWAPGDELFQWMMTRIWQLGPGGFRALLWHQGESDVAMPTEDYFAKLAAIIAASQEAAGWHFPWGVAKVSYHNPDNPRFETTRAAHQALWDAGLAFAGPDTDDLTGDHRDMDGLGIHFSPKGLKAHGEMWADCIRAWLDCLLEQ